MTFVAQKIKNRIKGKGRGWAFTPKDFIDLGPRNNVGQILHRLTKQGFIRQVSRGVYDYPRHHPDIGIRVPDVKQVVDAVARKTGDRIYPTGAQAANNLGLTTQVPAHPWYVTTGKPRTVRLSDKFVIKLQRATLPNTLTHRMAYIALQALDNLGPRIVDQDMIDTVAQKLDLADKKDIHANLRYIRNPWLADVARQLSA